MHVYMIYMYIYIKYICANDSVTDADLLVVE